MEFVERSEQKPTLFLIM